MLAEQTQKAYLLTQYGKLQDLFYLSRRVFSQNFGWQQRFILMMNVAEICEAIMVVTERFPGWVYGSCFSHYSGINRNEWTSDASRAITIC